jgi:acyl-CoA dehydrogenase
MDFALTEEQAAVREAISRICQGFGDDYWLARDKDGHFPVELHQALARDGWLGICMPEEFGGS